MQLRAFRITNFRSIVDSKWIPFSPDGVTVFVGQNESGKSSVLQALALALSSDPITSNDVRIGAPLPTVTVSAEVSVQDIHPHLADISDPHLLAVTRFFDKHGKNVELHTEWTPTKVEGGVQQYESVVSILSPELAEHLADADEQVENAPAPSVEPAIAAQDASSSQGMPAESTVTARSTRRVGPGDVAIAAWRAMPLSVLFDEDTGHLPNLVDIDPVKKVPTGPGAKAAQNYLRVADLDLGELLRGDRRAIENTLNKANSRVSQDFNTFWSQTIGGTGKLALKCEVVYYSDSVTEKAGKPHLVFWICNGNTQLYPDQRSRGVRWFVSFYLQLKASEKSRALRLFLFDEPGANLHSKAQGDVLHLVNALGKDTSTVVYSTHSPQMLEYEKLYRVHAVQRDGHAEDSPTSVIDAHRLGTASSDTLSPVLTAMGVDLSQHQVVRKKNNVLLEEMSGFYYLSAFWMLTGEQQEAHFIAATGVNKIEALANMFRGWGLDFAIAVDDDKQGRDVYKTLKRELFGGDDDAAKQRMLKLPNGRGIEDTFSVGDFKRFVLADFNAVVDCANSEYPKKASLSKPVLAFNFAMSVRQGKVTLTSFETETQASVRTVVEAVALRLKPAST